MAVQCFYCGSRCRQTSIYVIGEEWDAPTVKVGYSGKVSKRLAQLRRQSGRNLTILARRDVACEFKAMDIESLAHDLLKQHWSGRGEWFSCPAIVAVEAVDTAILRLGTKGRRR